jgi:hypothetical protein
MRWTRGPDLFWTGESDDVVLGMPLIRLVGGVVHVVALYGAALFLPAGTWRWPRAWIWRLFPGVW